MSRPASGEITNLSSRRAYRPDFRGLASAQVRAAREKLSLDHDGFAAYLTDVLGRPIRPEILSRWENGTGTPPGDVVLAAAVAAQSGPAADRDPGEGVIPFADRGLISRQMWNAIIAGSADQLWLYGMAEAGYAEDDETPAIMAGAAAAGCDIRILLLAPDWAAIPEIDAAEGSPAGTLAARIRAALVRFTRMRDDCGGHMAVRVYADRPSVSVVRGDDEMLVTPYMPYFAGNNSPTFSLTEDSAPRMFGRYARQFSRAWELAREAA